MNNVFSFMPSNKIPSLPKADAVDIDEAKLVQEVISVLYAEAAQRQFWMEIHEDNVRYSERGLIILPISTSNNLSTHEETAVMLALEDAWNDEEPPPVRRVHLAHAWNPEISIRSTPPPLVNQTV